MSNGRMVRTSKDCSCLSLSKITLGALLLEIVTWLAGPLPSDSAVLEIVPAIIEKLF